MTQSDDSFKPYISPNESPAEMTVTAIIVGNILSIVFGAANAYLGLRVGMTISASIPTAVISMMVLRVMLRRNSILENNMVQTIASAGTSVASGVIFTVPAFFLWEAEGKIPHQPFSLMTLLALFGGILGVMFMIPLRRMLIVKEHKTLPFPEGRACATVLLSAEKQGMGGKLIFVGAGLGAILKLLMDGCKMFASTITLPIRKLHTEISTDTYPALLGVGYICKLEVAATLFAGSIISWFVLIPAIYHFGNGSTLYPAQVSIQQLYTESGASGIWGHYIRYIGAGAVATGGIIGLIQSLPMMISSFTKTIRSLSKEESEPVRTDKDLSNKVLAISIIGCLVLLVILPQIPLNFGAVVLFTLCGFFFAVVSSRIAGVIGSSNSPSSGMTIAALLISAIILKKAGISGTTGMLMSLTIAVLCCVITCLAGDLAQDLSTGYLLGATPWKQQLGEIIGVFASGSCVCATVILLNKAWGFGSKQLPAPQAHLMKLVTEGIMQDSMAWTLVLIGCAIAIAMACLKVSPLCVAIGIFLPISATVPILLGGLARYWTDYRKNQPDNGILLASGFIAGEGVMGIFLAMLAATHIDSILDLSKYISTGMLGSAVLVLGIMFLMAWVCRGTTANEENTTNLPQA